MKKQALEKAVATTAKGVAVNCLNWTCTWLFHQPKLLTKLNKYKKY